MCWFQLLENCLPQLGPLCPTLSLSTHSHTQIQTHTHIHPITVKLLFSCVGVCNMELYNLRTFPLISPLHSHGASQMALVVKNPPANAGDIETLVWSLGWEYPLEEGTATHSSTLAWRILWTEESGGLQSLGSQRVGYNWSNLACSMHRHNFKDFIHLPSFFSTASWCEVGLEAP